MKIKLIGLLILGLLKYSSCFGHAQKAIHFKGYSLSNGNYIDSSKWNIGVIFSNFSVKLYENIPNIKTPWALELLTNIQIKRDITRNIYIYPQFQYGFDVWEAKDVFQSAYKKQMVGYGFGLGANFKFNKNGVQGIFTECEVSQFNYWSHSDNNGNIYSAKDNGLFYTIRTGVFISTSSCTDVLLALQAINLAPGYKFSFFETKKQVFGNFGVNFKF